MMDTSLDYRELLKMEFQSRSRKNVRYSSRAFARDIGIAPSRLSELLQKKRGLSRPVARRIAVRLGLSEREREIFETMVEAESGRSAYSRQSARAKLRELSKLPNYQVLSDDQFRLIADWYHFAILEFCCVRGFRRDLRWIAKSLDIPLKSAREALLRLQRLALLRVENGKLVPAEPLVMTTDSVSSAAIRSVHSQLLELAGKALSKQPIEQREFNAMMFAVDSNRIAEARELIRNFCMNFGNAVQSSPSKDSLYCLGIQWFRMDQEVS